MSKAQNGKRLPMVLKSVDEIVDVFGRPSDYAAFLGISRSNVSLMMSRNRIPPNHHYVTDREVRRRGHFVHPKLFGDRPTKREKEAISAEAKQGI